MLVIKAPPGGGKSTLLAELCFDLASRYGLSMTVATPTREQARSIGRKLLDHLPAGHVILALSATNPADVDARWAVPVERVGWGKVEIRTLDSLRMSRTDTPSRLLIVDEAFQAPFALGASAARNVDQIVAVGDPGQIGPVVTVDTSVFDELEIAPHRPFAEVLPHLEGAQTIHLDATYRLGPRTRDLIAGLYDFDFVSRRPPANLILNGYRLPEIQGVATANVVESAVARARDLCWGEFEFEGERRAMTPDDVAVLTSLRVHAAEAGARLRALGLGDVTVGTADQLQGGQWPAVVVIDPLAASSISDHHLSLGRLCVMLTRHVGHCSFVTTPAWRTALVDADGDLRHHERIRRTILEA